MRYNHHDFITSKEYRRIGDKRYWLELVFDSGKPENVVVIMKNPSKATLNVSDVTVNRLTKYIYLNRNKYEFFTNIGKVIVLNLIPFYETDSSKLIEIGKPIIDEENMKIIAKYLFKNKKVIVAWGDHPKHLSKEYETLKNRVFGIILENKNDVHYVHSLSQAGNPKHAQGWGYGHELKKYTINF